MFVRQHGMRALICSGLALFAATAICGASIASDSRTPQEPRRESIEFRSHQGGWAIRSSELRNGNIYVQLRFIEGKTINAVYEPGLVLSRVWISGVPNRMLMVVTAQEQARLRHDLDEIDDELPSRSKEAHALVELAANFLPANTLIDPFDSNVMFGFKRWEKPEWTPICHLIGKPNIAVFTNGDRIANANAIVGHPGSRCRGRCGSSCDQIWQSRKNQYTQECFNHDLCRTTTGQNFGVCADEFWKAAAGYALAENCL